MKKSITFKVRERCPRIDLFLAAVMDSISRNQIEKLIRNGQVSLNGVVSLRKNRGVCPDDRVTVVIETPEEKEYVPSQQLVKLFEDEWLLVIDKPAGLVVHPGAGEKQETVLDLFRFYYPQINEMADQERPGIVHRLDKDTSGILILAKTEQAQQKMQELFQEREMQKTYLALVAGAMRFRNGTIDLPLARSLKNRARFEVPREERDDQREAITDFSVIRAFATFTFVRLMPHTGRTHQLRVHLAHFGNPVLGDSLYGNRKDQGFQRLALHAFRIDFRHPFSGYPLSVTSPLPDVLRRFMIENYD
ncbi:MAG: RluA family pseudouridine synthase [Candidatus Aminicenantes bacterium]|nr:RluA family pseudouridine synthase [Candidatus Aminicenantes bacterium]